MKEKPKRGRPALPEHKKYKSYAFSLSPLAVKKLLQIPVSERSMRVSRFLERCDPARDVREPGERISTDKE